MKNKNLAQVYLEVDEFSTRIKNKYGVNVGVYVKGKITGLSITLHELHKVIESAIMELHPEESGQMDFKTRTPQGCYAKTKEIRTHFYFNFLVQCLVILRDPQNYKILTDLVTERLRHSGLSIQHDPILTIFARN